MSEQPNKRRASIVSELALTFAAGAFVFLAFSGILRAYAP
jgi:hypothetical protein